MLNLFINTAIKLFFLLTPFFVTSMFISFTSTLDTHARRKIALRTTIAIIAVTFILYLFGRYIFSVLGITLDAFRIGAGTLLFLSAISLIRSNDFYQKPDPSHDFSVVPLAIPITVGPGTTGALMVLGAEITGWSTQLLVTAAALLTAVTLVGALLLLAGSVQKFLGRRGLAILSKLTGLILSAMSAQMIFTGIKNFLNL